MKDRLGFVSKPSVSATEKVRRSMMCLSWLHKCFQVASYFFNFFIDPNFCFLVVSISLIPTFLLSYLLCWKRKIFAYLFFTFCISILILAAHYSFHVLHSFSLFFVFTVFSLEIFYILIWRLWQLIERAMS